MIRENTNRLKRHSGAGSSFTLKKSDQIRNTHKSGSVTLFGV